MNKEYSEENPIDIDEGAVIDYVFRYKPSVVVVDTREEYEKQRAYFDFLQRNLSFQLLHVDPIERRTHFEELFNMWLNARVEERALDGYDFY